MKIVARSYIAFAVAVAGLAVKAQSPASLGPPSLTPSNRPVTSPYLNLAVGNDTFGGAAYQYFRQVRPEVEFRSADIRLGNEIQDVRRNVHSLDLMIQSPESSLGTTGHRTAFQSYGSFFPGLSRR